MGALKTNGYVNVCSNCTLRSITLIPKEAETFYF